MAAKVDQFTTTAAQDATLAEYGQDLDATVTLECGRCGGSGWIPSFKYVEGGVCFQCMGRPADVRRLVTVRHLLANARKRDLAAANRARKAAAAEAARDAWRTEHAELFTRATAVNVTWWENWKAAPSAEDLDKVLAEVTKREARDAARAAVLATAAPVQAGRIRITGRVVSFKEVEDHFSYSAHTITKILVEDDRGFRVYGTIPQALKDAVWESWAGSLEDYEDRHLYGPGYWKEHHLKGARVSFAAATEPSDDDPHFGFFKRATKAEYLGRA